MFWAAIVAAMGLTGHAAEYEEDRFIPLEV
jgi:hypothetical protein